MQNPSSGNRIAIILAFLAVYFVWGSTYLAMKVAVETIPPFLMAGSRFLFAGSVVYLFARLRGASAPIRGHWKSAFRSGALLMLVGNGGVVWAQQFIPTGLAALLVTTTPLFIALLEWAIDGRRPTVLVAASLFVGLAGMVYLVGPGSLAGGGGPMFAVGVGTILVASFGWSLGSVLVRKGEVPASPWLLAGMQMMCGGALLLAASFAIGEPMRFSIANVSVESLLGMAYLIVFGSWVAYTAFTWLMRNVSPTLVSTYAFVNPVVAVLLGWAFYGEHLRPETLVAGAVIVASVALMVTSHALGRRKPVEVPRAAERELVASCERGA